ncbi:peptidylprolyl isomerase [Frankia sp. CNm7]|uniref:Peptidylprolyl isomerase n=2 Tax=Frankia nepalensis TaxID=1836974 RepID=A0A937UN32_9ACTN|nr:peptidylprolyl isomerase [Frankia nepalensis]MBL7509732.1 peptidylprolyl isomerase [Frankia nepalensis]MBL7516920.1 peptidylprolyl isomerase [Frankia nepalensis]MBL7629459.1 peptidylprolyl isomerase [Frankia nepalensis]
MVPGAGPVDAAAGRWGVLPPPRDPAAGPWLVSGAGAATDEETDGEPTDLDEPDLDDPDDDRLVKGDTAARVAGRRRVAGTPGDSDSGTGTGTDVDTDEDGEEDEDEEGEEFDPEDFDEPDFDDDEEDDEDEDDRDDGPDDGVKPSWQKDISAVKPRRRELAPEVKVAAFGILAALLLTAGAVVLAKTLGGDDSSSTDTTVEAQDTPSAEPPATSKVGDCVYTADGAEPSRPVTLPPAGPGVDTNPAKMVITTNLGTMTATLDTAKAPCTVHALRYLAEQKFFDATPCHRMTGPNANIKVLQCGDPTGTSSGGPGFRYDNENVEGVNYNRGVIAMANAGAYPDGSGSNGSQFFINYGDPNAEGTQALAGGYTVIGQITEGLETLDKITGPGVEGGAEDGPPSSKPEIQSITITQ